MYGWGKHIDQNVPVMSHFSIRSRAKIRIEFILIGSSGMYKGGLIAMSCQRFSKSKIVIQKDSYKLPEKSIRAIRVHL